MGEDPAAIRQEIELTRERMGDTVDALGYKADVPARTRDSIQDKVQGVRERITGVGSQVSGATQGMTSQVSDATPDADDVRQAGRQAVGLVQENPLGLAIGAAAVGFLAGMLIPSTRVEDERLGPVADQVKDQAQQTAQEALERGKQVAQETANAATESAQQAASNIKETAQQSGQQHAQDLKESAQDNAQQVRDRVTQ
jgi:gas vesicle protein